jgi:hypothetical protein
MRAYHTRRCCWAAKTDHAPMILARMPRRDLSFPGMTRRYSPDVRCGELTLPGRPTRVVRIAHRRDEQGMGNSTEVRFLIGVSDKKHLENCSLLMEDQPSREVKITRVLPMARAKIRGMHHLKRQKGQLGNLFL